MSAEARELVLRPDEEVTRGSGIGGSDIAAIVGLNPYVSPFDCWLEKTGKAPARVETEPMFWGKTLEPKILEVYEKRERRALVSVYQGEPMRHPDRAWQIFTPDALAPPERTVVDAKAPGLRQAVRYGPQGTDIVPEEHYLQLQWYCSGLDYDAGHLAVLLGGQDFRIYRFERDRELEAMLLEHAEKFWRENVQADIPPEIKDTDYARDWLRRTFPEHLVPLREATESEHVLAVAYAKAEAIAAAAAARCGNLKIALEAAIGSAEGLKGDGWKITYRSAKDGTKTDWQAVAAEYANTLALIGTACQNSSPELYVSIAQSLKEIPRRYTKTSPGSRRFLPTFEQRLLQGETHA